MRFNSCIMGLSVATMLLTIVLSPWMFGSVQLWAQVICLAGALCAAFLALFLPAWSKLPPAAWGGMAIVFLALVQLFRFSSDAVAILSPMSIELSNFFGVVPSSVRTLSLEPSATRTVLSAIIGVVLVYFAASRCTVRWMIPWVLVAITMNGVVLSLLGIWQQQFSGNKIFGVIAPAGAAPFGPFVNKNNAAGFLLASLSAALSLVLSSFASNSESDGEHYFNESPLRALIRSRLAQFGIVSGVVIISGILASMSRGGSVALFAGAVTTGILAVRRTQLGSALALLVVVSVGAISVLVLAGELVPVSNRVALAFDETRLAVDGRISIWADCWTIFRDFWMTGTGLGTFRGVFRVYDSNPDGIVASHAENFLVQFACEGGLPMLLLSLAIYFVLFRNAVHLLLEKRVFSRSMGTAWLFLLVSQFIASCFDFGLYIPAIAYQLAFLIGIYSSASANPDATDFTAKASERTSKDMSYGFPWWIPLGNRRFEFLLMGMLFLGLFGAVDLIRAASLETLPLGTTQASLGQGEEEWGESEFDRLSRNIVLRSDDSKAHFAIAEWHIKRFETELAAELPSGTRLPLSGFASRFVERRKAKDNPDLANFLESDVIRKNLVPALDHLHASRKANLFDPNVHLRLSHLSFLNPQSDGGKDLERMVRLLEGKRYQQFMQGLSEYKNGQYSDAFQCWKPCLENKSHYRTQIVLYAMQVKTVDQLLVDLFPNKKWFLLELANRHLTDPKQQDLRLRVLELARDTKS